jgi:uncharacterized protein (TIGR00255 family)
LDLSIRLPEGFADMEMVARRQLQAHFIRGRVECTLKMEPEWEGGNAVPPSLALNEGLLKAIITLEQGILHRTGHSSRSPLSLDRLMTWPGLIQEAKVPEDDAFRASLLESLNDTILGLENVRRTEGDALAEVMIRHLEALEERMARVADAIPRVRQEQEQRMKDRVSELEASTIDETRLAQEVAFLLNRMEIAEELDRLRIHWNEMGKVLGKGGAVGKRLDFLCQEMHREVNTIGSKSQDGELSQLGVDMKILVEKMREQVQNIQ